MTRLPRMRWGLAVAMCLAVLALESTVRGSDLPSPQGPVSDFVGVLDAETKQALVSLLRDVEKETTAEIAVAVVSSLDGLSIEDYADRLFQAWGIGQKGVDNGVLVVVAPNERHVRIEVGYGLEPIVPDGLAGEIIQSQFLPKFRDQDFAGGIRDGVERLASIVKRQHVLTGAERQALADSAGHRMDWILVPFFGLFVLCGGIGIGLGVRAKAFGAILFGLVMGGIPLLMGVMLTPAWGQPVLMALALGAAVIGYYKGADPAWRRTVRETSPSSGWAMGGGSSSGSSSSGSSSSDSFGGGSSGGGGASGSW